jgi:tRNA nucleotidyltransferase (CCA-adding enzyme)
VKIYLVGGAVRDALLNKPVHERDFVVVGSTVDDMLKRGFRQVGKDFPVFLHPQTGEEYALARTERKTAKGYTGFSVYAAPDVTLEADLQRRDLTINAIAQSDSGELIDPYGGLSDIQGRVLRHVSNAFVEDPLRVLRVARFAARFAGDGFTIAPETLTLMRTISASGELAELAAERVWRETEKALHTHHVHMFWRVIADAQAWSPWFMPLANKLNIAQLGEQLKRLPTHFNAEELAQMRWVLTCLALTPSEHEQLAQKLKLPNAYAKLAYSAFQTSYSATHKLSPQWFFDTIGKADGWRRKTQFMQLVGVWQALGMAADTAQALLKLYEQALSVSAREVIASAAERQQQLAGPAIGEAIRQQQQQLIEAHWRDIDGVN